MLRREAARLLCKLFVLRLDCSRGCPVTIGSAQQRGRNALADRGAREQSTVARYRVGELSLVTRVWPVEDGLTPARQSTESRRGLWPEETSRRRGVLEALVHAAVEVLGMWDARNPADRTNPPSSKHQGLDGLTSNREG